MLCTSILTSTRICTVKVYLYLLVMSNEELLRLCLSQEKFAQIRSCSSSIWAIGIFSNKICANAHYPFRALLEAKTTQECVNYWICNKNNCLLVDTWKNYCTDNYSSKKQIETLKSFSIESFILNIAKYLCTSKIYYWTLLNFSPISKNAIFLYIWRSNLVTNYY